MKTDINHILRQNPRPSSRGAPMGASGFYDGSPTLYLQRVHLVDGGYGADGTYWGGGYGTAPLWCAFNKANAEYATAMGTRVYTRARSREEAKRHIQQAYAVQFYR